MEAAQRAKSQVPIAFSVANGIMEVTRTTLNPLETRQFKSPT